MSRSSRSAAATMPPHQDILMGPPPLPPQLALSASQSGQQPQQQPSDSQDVNEKYRRLKRKYFELEEKHKDSSIELKSSGERAVRWRNEKAALLERIMELESNTLANPNAPIPAPHFTALPRSLINNPHNHRLFVTNLEIALDEAEHEDHTVDPILLSRHVGPQARKRQEAELKEKQEEEAREARRNSRRRGGATAASKVKELGAPLTFAPSLSSGPSPAHNASPPILVSSTGARLRLKPPAPPADLAPPPPTQHHAPPPPPTPSHQRRGRSESPLSPITPQDEFAGPGPSGTGVSHHGGDNSSVALSPSAQYRQAPSDPFKSAQAQMQMTLRPSPSSVSSRPSDMQRHAKPKRLKAHTVTTRSFSIPMVPRDKKGRPLLPLNVGIMTVLSLGEVCMREHFHTERYIFPVGYEVTRRYYSTVHPDSEVVYHCTILDGGDGPKFQITASDMPPVIAGTATGAWSVIVRTANHIRSRQHSNSVSGPDFFGLGQNTIKHLIQQLPGADMLKDYVWQNFLEGGPLGGRHAAVTPLLPGDADGSGPGTNGNGTASGSGNGVDMAPSPQYTLDGDMDRPRELQIIHINVENDHNHVHSQSHSPPQPQQSSSRRSVAGHPPTNMTSTIKPITFHQEYPRQSEREREREQRERERERELEYAHSHPQPPIRERRNSRASNHSYEEYHQGGAPDPHHPHPHAHLHSQHSPPSSHSHPHAQAHSPPPHRMSHSPVLHRVPGDRDRDRSRDRERDRDREWEREREHAREREREYSPPRHHHARTTRSSHAHASPYQEARRPPSPSLPPPVPATFASIMHAYPAPPMSGVSPQLGEAYPNGAGERGSRRGNGHGRYADR